MDTSYIIVTAAKNEAAFIENLIKSVVTQTILPARWVIVSDGSTDRTNEIVLLYANQYPFIHLIALESDNARNFGSHAKAFNYGCQQIKNIEFEFIGNLDADLTFEPDYYEKLISKFKANPQLGITSGVITEYQNGQWKVRSYDRLTFTAGALQFFRKECFEQIGYGYLEALHMGGYDTLANVLALVKGWQVEPAPELLVCHYRPTGTAIKSIFNACSRAGKRDYMLGKPPLFYILKSFFNLFKKPIIIGSCLSLAAYFSFLVRRVKIPASKDVIQYFRDEQFKIVCYEFKKAIRLKQKS